MSGQLQGLGSTRLNRAVIDLGAVRENVSAIVQAMEPVSVIATVKANAYGHGAMAIARTAVEAGAIGAATGDLESALRLRSSGVTGILLVFPGPTLSPSDLDQACQASLALTVQNTETVETWAATGGRPIEVFLKVALGLERLGVTPEEIPSLAAQINAAGRLRCAGVIGHLHAAPAVSDSYVQWQLDRFSTALDGLEHTGLLPATRVVASTRALLRSEHLRFDRRLTAVDPGALLLGVGVRDTWIGNRIRPALVAITSRLLQVRSLSRDKFIDSAPFRIRPNMRLGVLPIGRADGFGAIHAGRVLVRGRAAAILAIWTEHTAIDLTDIPSASTGDEAVLYGAQESDEITMEEILRTHPSSQELDVALSLSPSILREYVGDFDRVVSGKDGVS